MAIDLFQQLDPRPRRMAISLALLAVATASLGARLLLGQQSAPAVPAVQSADPKPSVVLSGSEAFGMIASGVEKTYTLPCASDEAIDFTLDQRGIAVNIRGRSAGQGWTRGVDFTESTFGRGYLTLPGAPSGTCEISLSTDDKPARSGTFRLHVRARIKNTEQALAYTRAQASFVEAVEEDRKTGIDSARKAAATFRAAAEAWRELGDEPRRFLAQVRRGLALQRISDRPAAIAIFTEAAQLAAARGDRAAEGLALSARGEVHGQGGEYEHARTDALAALERLHQADDPYTEALTASNLGLALGGLGDVVEAEKRLRAALELARTIDARELTISALHNLASLQALMGLSDQALAGLSDALAMARESSAPPVIAAILNQLGWLYAHHGRYDLAKARYRECIEIQERISNHRGLGRTLNNLGSVLIKAGEAAAAVASLQSAIEHCRTASDPACETGVLSNLALSEIELHRDTEATAHATAAVARAHSLDNDFMLSSAQRVLGDVLARTDDLAGAEAAYRQAIDRAQAHHVPAQEIGARHALARLALRRGDAASAWASLEPALALAERIGESVQEIDLQLAVLADHQGLYATGITALTRLDAEQPGAGHAARAFALNERRRARQILHMLKDSGVVPTTGAAVSLVEAERAGRARLTAAANTYLRQLRGNADPKQIALLLARVKDLETDLQIARAKLVAADPIGAAAIVPSTATVGQAQDRLLDESTLLLSFSLGEPTSHGWVVTKDAVRHFSLPPRAELVAHAVQLRKHLLSPDAPTAASDSETEDERALSDTLLGSVPQNAKVRKLVVVADGALSYVPFSMLRLPLESGRPKVIERFELAFLPSASVGLALREHAPAANAFQRTALLIADPVYERSDPRLDGALPAVGSAVELDRAFVRLPFTRREALGIARVLPPGSVEVRLDFDATRDVVRTLDAVRPRVVHFATHGIVDDRSPALSGLMLSRYNRSGAPIDGLLGLRDLYTMRLSADLVVLSGCDTAIGEAHAGEGLLAVSRGFMQAGARRVVASLWAVDESATAALMTAFYRELATNERGVAAALQLAQREIAREPRWSAPYYWAGFVLQGDWI